jgi:hypothetical protein
MHPSIAADDAAKALAERLTAELRRSQDQLADLEAENKKLRAELKDEQLKNAIDVDQEIKRLRDLLRFAPDKEATAKALAQAKDEAEKERARSADHAAAAKAAQAEAEHLRNELQKRAAESKAQEDRLARLIEQVAAIQRDLAESRQPTPPPGPKVVPQPGVKVQPPAPPPDDGPTALQLKRLEEALRQREAEARAQAEIARADAERALKQAEKARGDAEDRIRVAGPTARAEAEQALIQAEKARRDAEERIAMAAPKVDPSRLEAEIRAAKLEAQLQVMQMAYMDLRQEAARLRAELDAERKGRAEQASRPATAADPKIQQRVENLEVMVTKLSSVVEQITKKLDAVRPEK